MRDNPPQHRGPLAGVRIVEFAGLGPAPFPEAVDTRLAVIRRGDVVIEGFRPGVMERPSGSAKRRPCSIVMRVAQ